MRPIKSFIIALVLLGCLGFAGNAAAVTPCDVGVDLNYSGDAWPLGTTVGYYVIRSSLPPSAGDSAAEAQRRQDRLIARIRNGAGTWNSGKNDCQYRSLHGFRTGFLGDSGSSAADNSDGKNTIDFALGTTCGRDGTTYLNACTHVRRQATPVVRDYRNRPRDIALEFDMRFNLRTTANPVRWYSGVGSPCSGCMDTWAIAAHEWGHVIGLDHSSAAKDRWQTMYPETNVGETYPRTLGRSDWLGLKGLYGP